MQWIRTLFLPLGLSLFSISAEAKEKPVSFSRDIRPLLSDRCFKCHGFDEQTREAGLGLHNHAAATSDLGGYQAITPGDWSASEVITRITSSDPDEVMPPPSANKPRFSESELDLMKRWIAEGAKYEEHWAFAPPKKSPLPSQQKHPIDSWLDARISEEKIAKNERGNPYVLLRRLSLDLRGIPPTPEETDSFIHQIEAQDWQKAWGQQIDQFLASQAYGERWAREWLDLARYADTNGYEKDRPRSIWPYRDWVIDALNRDMPYDQFSIEQLAGDMLPNATLAQRIATGFHRNTMINEEGGIDPLEYRYHAVVDRVATTGTVWLGLTTGCAQCHTHKFDPITHTDYFSLFALLNNADEPDLDVPDIAVEEKQKKLEKQITELENQIVQKIDPRKYRNWKKDQLQKTTRWIELRPTALKSTLPNLQVMPDNSVFASGDFQKRDIYDLEFDLSKISEPIAALRIEALPDPNLPAHGPGAAYYEGRKGDFFLSEVTAKDENGDAIPFRSANVSFGKIYIGSGSSEGSNVFDGNGSSGWSTATAEGQRNELVIHLSKPSDARKLHISLLFERHFVAALGRLRVSASTEQKEIQARGGEISQWIDADEKAWKQIYIQKSADFAEERKQINQLRNSIPSLPTTLVMREWSTHTRKTYRHHRGEYLQAREEVQPAVPAIFPPIPDTEPQNRLGLAKWLVSERNPLAARVTVNRAWRSFFGRGIVHTSGDFGYQSELPTHPELLDWLAVELVEQGWSLKKLHRIITTSEAYQRSSVISSQAREKDPENKFLARGPRFRLSGEMLRDAALASSGLLSKKLGGPSVYPPQPASVTALAYGKTNWKVSEGEDRYRRSLYTFSKRTAPFAAYLAFDGPTGEMCLPRRDRSNTPLQALTLLNDPMFGEAAAALADLTLLGQGPNPVESRQIITQMFRHVLTRPPSKAELDDLTRYFESQKKRIDSGELKFSDVSAEKAAWTMVARVLLNLNESITKG